jgi:hypothetical protein
LSLRFFTAIQLAIAAQLLFSLSKRFLPPLVAFLIAFTWIIQLSARIPWASIPVTIFALLAIIFLLDQQSDQSYLTNNKWKLFFAGCALAFACIFRLQAIVLFLMLSIGIILFENNRKRVVYFWLGFTASLFSFLTTLFSLSALSPLILQTITWPSSFYKSPPLTKSYITDSLWYPIIFFTISLGFYLVNYVTQTLSYQNRTLASMIFVMVFVLLGISILMQERIGYLSFRYPKVILIDLTSHLANYLGYWSAVFVIVVTSILLARRFRCSDIEKRHDSRYFVLLLFGIGVF